MTVILSHSKGKASRIRSRRITLLNDRANRIPAWNNKCKRNNKISRKEQEALKMLKEIR